MSDVFGSVYGDAYDILYQDKNYAAECDLIEGIFKAYGDGSISHILDLGCGTGNHAFPLSERGYIVTGVDRSESMLAEAQRKLANASGNGRLDFQKGDLRTMDLQRDFDAAIMMFAVLGYQLGNSDVLSTLKSARRHLRSGGLLLFDVWYGPAVLHQRPSQRIKVVPTPEGQILRLASGEIDILRHVCTVHYRLWKLAMGRVAVETEESHRMRYFFPLELDFLLESSGFVSIRLGAFPDFDAAPDETTWEVLGLARAV